MPKANPLVSKGARIDRRSVSDYIERRIVDVGRDTTLTEREEELLLKELTMARRFIDGRADRYNARVGGLGTK